uniref:Putative conserved plasma membrane protein n=1 Tax=Amblyomma triste TaxID=251400 RepID=A0A023G619_AMBTT
MPEADTVSEGSSISRATDIDADWEDLADRPPSMMENMSMSVNQLLQRAASQIEVIRESEVYRTYLKDSPVLSAAAAIVLGVLSLPALTFLSFIIVLCLLTFMGFLFIEGTLITFGVIVTAGILFFIGTFVASFGCCLYALVYVLRTLKIVGSSAAAVADGTKKAE